MLKERFQNVAIGSTFIYGDKQYIKTNSNEAQDIEGTHVISFSQPEIESMLVESDGSKLLRG
jgi:hypothetical protein